MSVMLACPQLSEKDLEMAAISGTVNDLRSQIDQHDAAMAAMPNMCVCAPLASWHCTRATAPRCNAIHRPSEVQAESITEGQQRAGPTMIFVTLKPPRGGGEWNSDAVDAKASQWQEVWHGQTPRPRVQQQSIPLI